MHGDLITGIRGRAVRLNRHLRGGRRGQQRVRKDSPVRRRPVVGNRLDQITLGGAHSNPEREVSG